MCRFCSQFNDYGQDNTSNIFGFADYEKGGIWRQPCTNDYSWGKPKFAPPPKPTPTTNYDWGFHPDILCDQCKGAIGRKVRMQCLNCPDYDLCDTCFGTTSGSHFEGKHQFKTIQDSRT
eukprot:TRINITY_DN7409_c0_g1_i1.p1 TRINITY_DN7409_c0_g1~~TRINITY_DN7409_c0_g1_i1.p1  ORF type:complete len:119 (-),score=21.55 TRINITY_DN7409_c0_g1_i1:12-368(-)